MIINLKKLKQMKIKNISIILILFLSSCQTYQSIEGTVYDKKSNKKLSNSIVRLGDNIYIGNNGTKTITYIDSIETDENGNYFYQLESGKYILQVDNSNFKPDTFEYYIDDREIATHDFYLEKYLQLDSSVTLNNIEASSIKITNAVIGMQILEKGSIVSEILQAGHCYSIQQNPTLKNNYTVINDISMHEIYTNKIYNLTPNTTYYYKAYAISNFNDTIYSDEKEFTTLDTLYSDTRDGQVYKIVKIGNQLWFQENMNYITTNSFCYDNLNPNCDNFGRLYASTVSRDVCPDGWHLPSRNDFDTLINNFGGSNSAYLHLINGGNSGFDALLGGKKNDDNFEYMNERAYFWSSSFDAYSRHYFLLLKSSSLYVYISYESYPYNSYYNHVRCIKDWTSNKKT